MELCSLRCTVTSTYGPWAENFTDTLWTIQLGYELELCMQCTPWLGQPVLSMELYSLKCTVTSTDGTGLRTLQISREPCNSEVNWNCTYSVHSVWYSSYKVWSCIYWSTLQSVQLKCGLRTVPTKRPAAGTTCTIWPVYASDWYSLHLEWNCTCLSTLCPVQFVRGRRLEAVLNRYL